ncbi:MAG TPA: glycosyltransferase family 39 protein [archaeon]|nr:glycosyltransferase family 39 protein [archaeon]
MPREIRPAADCAPASGREQSWPKASAALREHPDVIAGIVIALGFCWRLWLAYATFFNTDEAWHYSVVNQNSLRAAYKASLALAHPPLLVFILYFWRHLGTSDVMLRFPGVVAGTVFCWIFYKWLIYLFGRVVAWCGLIFAAFLPPMIALSAELRQYSLLLMFSIAAAYQLERALSENSVRAMLLSCACLWLAMLSHYSAFLFCAGLGIYAILRMSAQRPSNSLIACWSAGQIGGLALAAFLYVTQIAKLGSVYPGDPLRRFGDFYLADVYFHAGRENLLHFLYRGTFGVFRFMCGQRTAGHLTTVLFVAGVVLLLRAKTKAGGLPRTRTDALLLIIPFLLSWIAVIAGLYPYGRTRQCIFLAVFGIAGVSTTLARVARNRAGLAVFLAIGIVAWCHIFGVPHGLDMLAFAEQRPEHMERAVRFLQDEVQPSDLVFTDKPTSFQLVHYMCGEQPLTFDQSVKGFAAFRCNGLRIVSTDLSHGSLTPQNFGDDLQTMERGFNVNAGTGIWVIQAAWSRGLGEALRSQSGEFSGIEPRSFDYYIEVFKLPRPRSPAPTQLQ